MSQFSKYLHPGTLETCPTTFSAVSGLVQLHEEMAKIGGQLPPDDAKDAAQDLETFTHEATKAKPRRKQWQLSAEGIMKAAQSVGQVGATAIVLVKELLPLMGG